jgi:PAS domain S-box-containing protein
LKSQLDEKKSQLIAILNSIQSIAYLKGVDGRVIAGNQKFEELAGIGIENLIGKNPASIFELKDEEILNSDKELLEKKEIIISEKEMNTPLGKKWIEIQKTPVFDEEGEIIGITVLISDISERKHLEDLTIKAKRGAIAANNFKSQFLPI